MRDNKFKVVLNKKYFFFGFFDRWLFLSIHLHDLIKFRSMNELCVRILLLYHAISSMLDLYYTCTYEYAVNQNARHPSLQILSHSDFNLSAIKNL